MRDLLIMNKKERRYKSLLDQVLSHHITKNEAATRLNISYRHLNRLLKDYALGGDASLVHKSRGKPSSRAYPADVKEKVLKLYRTHYKSYGPQLASEKLEERDKITIHPETLRLWLKSAGLWSCHRKRKT